jgi:hypothetical protein
MFREVALKSLIGPIAVSLAFNPFLNGVGSTIAGSRQVLKFLEEPRCCGVFSVE